MILLQQSNRHYVVLQDGPVDESENADIVELNNIVMDLMRDKKRRRIDVQTPCYYCEVQIPVGTVICPRCEKIQPATPEEMRAGQTYFNSQLNMQMKMDPEVFRASLPQFESVRIVHNEVVHAHTTDVTTDTGLRRRGKEYIKQIRKRLVKAGQPIPRPLMITWYLDNYGADAEEWRSYLGLGTDIDTSYEGLRKIENLFYYGAAKPKPFTAEMKAKAKNTPVIRSTQKGGKGTVKRQDLPDFKPAKLAINKAKAKSMVGWNVHSMPLSNPPRAQASDWMPPQTKPSGPPPSKALPIAARAELAWHQPVQEVPKAALHPPPKPPPADQSSFKGREGKGKTKGKDEDAGRERREQQQEDRATWPNLYRRRWNRDDRDHGYSYWPDRRDNQR